MLEFAGQDLTDYFPPPMTIACPGLVTSDQLSLQRANFTPVVAYAVHTSGALYTGNSASLKQDDWYTNTLQPALQQYYKGYYVYTKGVVESGYESDSRYDISILSGLAMLNSVGTGRSTRRKSMI